MSARLYVGNLPQTFESKELESLLASVGEGIRFKAVLDRETGACRGFGFANVKILIELTWNVSNVLVLVSSAVSRLLRFVSQLLFVQMKFFVNTL